MTWRQHLSPAFFGKSTNPVAKYPAGKECSFVTCYVDELFCMTILTIHLEIAAWDRQMNYVRTQHSLLHHFNLVSDFNLTQVLAFGTLPWRPNIAKEMLQVPVRAIPLLNFLFDEFNER